MLSPLYVGLISKGLLGLTYTLFATCVWPCIALCVEETHLGTLKLIQK